jgi:hypothetical protein
MTVCPKCGSCKIIGPRYEHEWCYERLRYRCFTCGYSMTTPTADHYKAPDRSSSSEGR